MELNTNRKVLFVIDTLEVGGAEQSLLSNAIRFKNLKPVICHLYKGELLKPRFLEKGIPVHSLGIQKKYGFGQALQQLKKIVEEEQPDIMVAYLTRSEIVTRITGRRQHIPVIGTFVSDLYSKNYNSALSRKSKLIVTFFKQLNKWTARYCKGFIANSEATKEINAEQLGIAPDRIEVINRGRESKLFAFRTSTLTPGKPLRFVNVGRLVPVKGQRDIIQAFARFLSTNPDATLHIIGDGPEKESLSSLIKELGVEKNISLLGAKNDVPQRLSEYDCFIFPSHSEGFSGSVVEAMFAGLPVLASDIPVNKEVITHFDTGYLFEKGSVENITKAMCWFKDHLSEAGAMADRAHRFAKQQYELETLVSKMETYLLNKIIEKK